MNPTVRETLRWLILLTLVIQPILLAWVVVIAMRIRVDQERMEQFVKVWGERMAAQTNVADIVQFAEIQAALKVIQESLPKKVDDAAVVVTDPLPI